MAAAGFNFWGRRAGDALVVRAREKGVGAVGGVLLGLCLGV